MDYVELLNNGEDLVRAMHVASHKMDDHQESLSALARELTSAHAACVKSLMAGNKDLVDRVRDEKDRADGLLLALLALTRTTEKIARELESEMACRASDKIAEVERRELLPTAWQPIDTAPMDGTVVILTDGISTWASRHSQRSLPGDNPWIYFNSFVSRRYDSPTHWCQLPEPP